MKINITSKNLHAADDLKAVIEKKFDKLCKYFSDDIEAQVILSQERGRDKVEATINARGMIFRAEESSQNVLDSIESVAAKLSSQMSRYKSKLRKKHKNDPEIFLDDVPEADEAEIRVVRKKKFQLEPMTTDEAILQMELLNHTFFIFLNVENDSVNLVYKRNDGDYGLLETVY